LKPVAASCVAASKARATSASARTMRMPRPPPPPDALRMTGKPMRVACSVASAASFKTPVPGSSGKPKRAATPRELTLSPHMRIASAVGPMKAMRQFLQTSANFAFSDRKP
jgi:hypothetical protein